MSAPLILAIMSTCFLLFGYLGVPVPFSLMGGVFIGAWLAEQPIIVQSPTDGCGRWQMTTGALGANGGDHRPYASTP